MEDGGVAQKIRDASLQQGQPQTYAKGGEVSSIMQEHQSNPIADVYPEQNVLLNSAKARISGYLNSVRPHPNPTKLPYDSEQKDPQKEREYNKTLDLAANPLSILKHVKDGTLGPKQMAAFNAMYPDLHQHLSKK